MAQYILRKTKFHYEIAKFEDSDQPTSVYVFGARGCNCPANGTCKHHKILTVWKKAGEILGQVFDDEAKHLGQLNVA